MANLNSLFSTFNNTITLTSSKSDDLKRGRDALRGKIKTWFKDSNKKQPSFCWQGSFAMKTTVNPLAEKEYDLDDGVYLAGYSDSVKDSWIATSTAHSWVKKAVEDHTQETPVDKDTCVRVIYTGSYHIDFPIYIEKDDIAYLAHKTEGWIESDPKAFKDWFIERVQFHSEQLRNIVKYLKAWKDYKEIPLKGIEITILAAQNFDSYEGRDDKSLKNTIDNIIYSLETGFNCYKPVCPYENLFEGISQTKKDQILNGFKNLNEKLANSIVESNEAVAADYMIEVFGSRFPKGKSEEPKKNASYVQTSTPGVLKHDGRSA